MPIVKQIDNNVAELIIVSIFEHVLREMNEQLITLKCHNVLIYCHIE